MVPESNLIPETFWKKRIGHEKRLCVLYQWTVCQMVKGGRLLSFPTMNKEGGVSHAPDAAATSSPIVRRSAWLGMTALGILRLVVGDVS